MSLATATATATGGAAAPAERFGDDDRPGVGRLTSIELRKIRDTRAGKWLLALTGLFTVGFVIIALLTGESGSTSFSDLVFGSMLPLSFLPPILAILALTSEWSQRTGLVSFALVPVRGRLIGAKLIATSALAIATVALGVLVSAIGAVLGGGGGSDMPLEAIGCALVFQLLFVTMGAAFGLAFMNSAVAIVMFFLLPSVLSALGGLVDFLREPLQWIDPNNAWLALMSPGATGEEWARIATAAALMIGVPLVAGLVRLRRTEIK